MTIVVVQSIAIVCLVIMALTELYSEIPIAITVAIIAYVFRQPLMHMAHPASNELMMNYVGKKSGINQCFKFQSLERFLVFEC